MPMLRSLRVEMDAALGRGDGLAADADLAAVRPLQAGDAAQGRGLAAAGRAQQRHEFALAPPRD